MRTTVDISDALLRKAKAIASRDKTTLRALIERGLRQVLRERPKKKPFRLRRATFRGRGVQPQVSEGNWATIRDLIYRERGG